MHPSLRARPLGAVIGAVIGIGLLAGCASQAPGSEAASEVATASPSPTASPTPAPPPPVEGAVELTAIHLEQAGQKVYPAGHPGDRAPEVDEDAVHAFAGAVADLLDAQLDALQRGEEPPLPGALGGDATPAAVAAITSALADPDHLVASAAYDTQVAVDGTPRWARVSVAVTHPDGSGATAELVFVATDDGPELVAAGPAAEVSS